MEKQSEALRLADKAAELIHTLRRTPMPLADLIPHLQANADELRRLHAENEDHIQQLRKEQLEVQRMHSVNAQLLEALEEFVAEFEGCYADAEPAMVKARAAIAAAKEVR